jgi:hypothetical protein
MNDKLKDLIGNTSLPDILNNPFLTDCIANVYVSFGKSSFSKEWRAYGQVSFTNGNTLGKQIFEGSTFDEVVTQIKIFIEELHKNKQ